MVLLLEEKLFDLAGDETGAKFVEEEVPADMKEVVEKWRTKLIEQISETDDGLLNKFLAGEEPGIAELKAALRRATIAYKLVPVFPEPAFATRVQPLWTRS